jgi:hypothetical protein
MSSSYKGWTGGTSITRHE